MTDRNVTQQLMSLVRQALWHTGDIIVTDYREVLHEARRQAVSGLVYSAIEQMDESHMPGDDILMPLVAEIDAIERNNARMNRAIASLTQIFARAGLRPTLLKGQGVATLYELPMRRQCGDIDIHFAKMPSANALRQIIGTMPTRMSDGALTFRHQGFEVEIHPGILDISNPLLSKRIRRLVDSNPPVATTLAESESDILRPAPIIDILLLVTHILKHAIGRGIGLRQFCDLAMACKAYHPTIDRDQMQQAIKSLHLTRWWSHLGSMLVLHLGMPEEYLPAPCRLSQTKADKLLQIVERGGNFGQFDESNRAGASHTAMAFLRRSRWSLRVAPMETLSTFATLLKGRITH